MDLQTVRTQMEECAVALAALRHALDGQPEPGAAFTREGVALAHGALRSATFELRRARNCLLHVRQPNPAPPES